MLDLPDKPDIEENAENNINQYMFSVYNALKATESESESVGMDKNGATVRGIQAQNMGR